MVKTGDGLLQLCVQPVRSVTTMTLAYTGLLSVLNREASRYAVHAMELDLPDPALCWMR